MFPPAVPEITVHELKAMMDADETPFILDVREEREYAVANLNGTLIPLRQIPYRLDELDAHKDDLIVVHCRSGARSAQAVQFMRAQGFAQAKNLRGGVLAWSREIDPSMPFY
jgi:adenylyltransferase/sulfurtransferase